ncbi:HTH_48 domain-containing protein [Trichonephila clavipes]|nr:HTH_48 domain-containing protein [Trichonephila clavipes]
MYMCRVEVLQAWCVYRTTDGSVIPYSSATRAMKSSSWRESCEVEVNHVEQRAYVKIAVFRGNNALECHSELVEVLVNKALPYGTLAWWVGKFQQGRVPTSDEKPSGLPVSVWTVWAHAAIEQLMDETDDERYWS